MEDAENKSYQFRFYVGSMTAKMEKSLQVLEQIGDQYLDGDFSVQVIDLSQTPEIGIEDQILATPTLVRRVPEPVRRIVGELNDTEKVLYGLELK